MKICPSSLLLPQPIGIGKLRRYAQGYTVFFESPLGSILMLYRIESGNKDVLFVESGTLAPVINYILQDKEPPEKWIELKRPTGEYTFVDRIGNEANWLYILILEL